MQPIDRQTAFGVAWRDGWQRLFRSATPRRRGRRRQRGSETARAAAIDPIRLTVMAVNRLGPATMRAVSLGVPVTVVAPDRETMEIFRAALDEMEKMRPTDRLVSVELINGGESGSARVARLQPGGSAD